MQIGNKNIPCFHLFIYKCFKKRSKGNYISYGDIKNILFRRFGKQELPKKLHYIFLQEMEEFGLIKKISTNKKCIRYELIAGNIDNCINQYLSLF